MPRLGLLNMIIGFATIFLAAAAGAFIATDLTSHFIQSPTQIIRWESMLEQSAHGHTNLFGMLHILFGLTLPYSNTSHRLQIWQSAGLFCGVIAMGPLLLVRSTSIPTSTEDALGYCIGALLSASLAALALHVYGLAARLVLRRN